METIAFYNLKGGVGKTTSAVNIAWQAASEGVATLIWDLDPQGAASWLLNSQQKSLAPKKLLTGKTPISTLVKSTDYANLDMIAADLSMRHFDTLLSQQQEKGRDDLIRQLVAPFAEQYQLIVLDCPPSFSLLSEQIFKTADALFVPLVPTPLSLRTFEQTRDFFKENQLKAKRLHGFFNMVDRRRTLHRVILTHPPKSLKNRLETVLPYSAMVEKMGEYRAPLGCFAGKSPLALAYQHMWHEMRALLGEFSGCHD